MASGPHFGHPLHMDGCQIFPTLSKKKKTKQTCRNPSWCWTSVLFHAIKGTFIHWIPLFLIGYIMLYASTFRQCIYSVILPINKGNNNTKLVNHTHTKKKSARITISICSFSIIGSICAPCSPHTFTHLLHQRRHKQHLWCFWKMSIKNIV